MEAMMGVWLSMLLGEPWAGVAWHPPATDGPEYNGTNPIGMYGADFRFKNSDVVIFTQHISSIPDSETGRGFNMIGVKIGLK